MDNGLMMSSLQWDIIDLAGHLRQERLFVSSEQQNLQVLNEKVVNVSSRLAQLAWVTAQQRDNLNRLIVSQPDSTPAVCCHRANLLDNTIFIDGYKVLGFQECLAYGEFLQNLRISPQLLASCLVAGDRLLPDMMHGIVHSIAAGLYGSSLLPEDKVLVLRLLRHLTLLQLVPSDNPRRLLRQRSCAFARLYAEFNESLFSAKLFLTAALHIPIMQLLVEHEMFLDIDPDKATVRFPPEERLKKFGVEGTPEYNIRLQEYRKWTNNCLVTVTKRFVKSLHENMHCFPSEVSWIVRQIASLLLKSGKIEPKEVNAICTDLVFTYFICPAIVNPEPYGITDAPISYISGFNLIQVAKIVQTLAMTKYEEVDGKVADLYALFEKDCVSSLLDEILDDSNCDEDNGPAIIDSSKLQGLTRSAALFTETELNNLVIFLQTVASEVQTSDDEHHKTIKDQLSAWLTQLPHSIIINGHSGIKGNNKNMKPGHQSSTPPDTPRKTNRLLGKAGKPKVGPHMHTPGINDCTNNCEEGGGASQDEELNDKADVLVIPFSPTASENIGLLAEQKVLMMDDCSNRISVPLSSNQEAGNVMESVESQTKRTRFSLSHDDGSIGNTSDNLEAVSEAASNHSVASSLELENEDQNDNLSDMVSANVSGRGTPNISGRDTPSSQITEGEEGPTCSLRSASGEARQAFNFPPSSTNKQSRTDIDDKFGKFEIKKLIEGDETVSMVSDTWSTDVLASDSETVEQSERNYPPSITESTIQQLSESTQMLDVSETASEAWSTDVLASDSERFTEIDTDDTGSVARSEVEVDPRAEPDGDETPPSNTPLGAGIGFRSIREEPVMRNSLLVPASPTRVDIGGQHSWNVTGRGGAKADYRRRTCEYVDNNANNIVHRREAMGEFPKENSQVTSTEEMRLIHVIDEIDKPPDVKPAVVAASRASINILHVPTGSLSSIPALPNGNAILPVGHAIAEPGELVDCIMARQTSLDNVPVQSRDLESNRVIARPIPVLHSENIDIDVKQEDDELERPNVKDAVPNVVRLSSVSLASTSSSGSSSDPRPKTAATGDFAVPPSAIPNGHAALVECEPATVKSAAAPHISTGAIPKSISFDKTAEKGDKELLDDDQKHKRSFFRNFKISFKNRRMKSLRGMDEIGSRYDPTLMGLDNDPSSQTRLRRGMSEELRSAHANTDTTEDILAKYRRKPSAGGESSASDSISNTLSQLKSKQPSDERLNIDRSNIQASYAFADAKRKLRMVLSTADLQHVPWMSQRLSHMRNSRSDKENELVSFLQLQLAEAINLQDRSLIAHLHETLRCIKLFDEQDCRKLFQSLKEDYLKRSPYIAYLVRCRQGLLSTLAHLERLTERVKCDRQVCSRFLIALCVTMFIEKREHMLFRFISEFQHLTLADEKTDLLDNFLQALSLEMEKDQIWQVASDTQLEQARMAVERAVMSKVYLHALYPNGDGDISRDQVLHKHMEKLSAVITPNHKDLRIPKVFHYECPWPSAQAEISAISAYKTPGDKLMCVFRCATTIMNLLSMACESGVPSADDLVPVLVYVLIKANPPSLLSTIQYVDSFYGNRMEGEEQYWWIQFCSAIEFIKTMDYND